MEFAELNNEQRRQLIDVRQIYDRWREANALFLHSFHGDMRWRRSHDREYLYHIDGKVRRSQGPRNEETEQKFRKYTEQRKRVVEQRDRLAHRLDEKAAVNRALLLNRVPQMATRILRKLETAGMLGRNLFVIGTHALYAYEAASGVIFDNSLTATDDLDLLWDARRRISFALSGARPEGVVSLLQEVDRTFVTTPGNFRVASDDGYMVDLLRPPAKNELLPSPKFPGDDDLEAAAIAGLEWLINTPKFEQTVIGADGKPLRLPTIDPRVFAVHKWWISQQGRRHPLKRKRDANQAIAVAQVAHRYLALQFEASELTAVPKRLVDAAPQLLAAAPPMDQPDTARYP